MSMKTAPDYAALAEAELHDGWQEITEGDIELAALSFTTAGVFANLAVAAATAALK